MEMTIKAFQEPREPPGTKAAEGAEAWLGGPAGSEATSQAGGKGEAGSRSPLVHKHVPCQNVSQERRWHVIMVERKENTERE